MSVSLKTPCTSHLSLLSAASLIQKVRWRYLPPPVTSIWALSHSRTAVIAKRGYLMRHFSPSERADVSHSVRVGQGVRWKPFHNLFRGSPSVGFMHEESTTHWMFIFFSCRPVGSRAEVKSWRDKNTSHFACNPLGSVLQFALLSLWRTLLTAWFQLLRIVKGNSKATLCVLSGHGSYKHMQTLHMHFKNDTQGHRDPSDIHF